MTRQAKTADLSGLYPAVVGQALAKLDPRELWSNPVMFVTAVVAVMTAVLGLRDILTGVEGAGTSLHSSAWLRICVIFANFAKVLADGRGPARADTLLVIRNTAEPGKASSTG